MTYRYFVFGLEVISEIEFPELIQSSSNSTPDLTIEYGKTPEKLDNITKAGVSYEVSKGKLLIYLDHIGRFYVSDGNKIIVEPKGHSDIKSLRVILLGSCMGAILPQRDVLALHASAIMHNGQAVLFSGSSGAGKSTTANAFRSSGNKMLTDDICPIKLQGGRYLAIPGFPFSKMWEDGLEQLNINYKNLGLVRDENSKRMLPFQKDFQNSPIEIKAIYILKTHNKKNIELHDIEDALRFKIIKNMTYRSYLINSLGLQAKQFFLISQVVNSVRLKLLIRPQFTNVDQVMQKIKNDLEYQNTIHV